MKKIIILSFMLFTKSAFAQNFSGDFESWRNYSVIAMVTTTMQAPVNWNAADSLIFFAGWLYPTATFSKQVYKTTDAHSGSYAVKLVTLYQDSLGALPALLTNADIQLDMSAPNITSGVNLIGGTPVSSRIAEMSAWVKYYPNGYDTAGIYVLAMKAGIGVGGSDSVIGGGQLVMTGVVNTYTKVSIPVTYYNSMVPNLLQVIIVSGSRTNPMVGSTLYVDDVSIATTGISAVTPSEENKLYPNPVKDILHIDSDVDKMELVNTSGQIVYTATHPHTVDVSSLAPGNYYLQLRDKNGTINNVQKLIKQ